MTPTRILEIDARDLPAAVGRELGPGPWHRITQEQVNTFAAATLDDQWIHVDVERAAAGPFGGTIAHGYLTLALLPALHRELCSFVNMAAGLNYGLEKVRFPHVVRVGEEVRLRSKVLEVEQRPDGSQMLKNRATIEINNVDKPACIAHTLWLVVAAAT